MPAYLVGTAFFAFVWALLYALAPRVRWYMLSTSLALSHFGLVLEYWYVRDYWRPQYLGSMSIGGVTFSFEDYVFGFAVSGLAAGLFALALPAFDEAPSRRSGGWGWLRLQTAGVVFVLLISLLAGTGAANSVHATFVACCIGAAAVYIRRPYWVLPGLVAGCALAALFFVFYEMFFLSLYPTIIEDWWQPSAMSGLTLRRVPVEEVAWGFTMGLFLGPLVRVCAGVPPQIQGQASDSNETSGQPAKGADR